MKKFFFILYCLLFCLTKGKNIFFFFLYSSRVYLLVAFGRATACSKATKDNKGPNTSHVRNDSQNSCGPHTLITLVEAWTRVRNIIVNCYSPDANSKESHGEGS